MLAFGSGIATATVRLSYAAIAHTLKWLALFLGVYVLAAEQAGFLLLFSIDSFRLGSSAYDCDAAGDRGSRSRAGRRQRRAPLGDELVRRDEQARTLIAACHELEEQVRTAPLER